MVSKPWAKTILRSRNAAAPEKVLSTLLVRIPRCILAEFNTHRVFSRNAASSRAIPVEKLIQQVIDDPFIPLVWSAHQSGMQGGAEISTRVSIPITNLIGEVHRTERSNEKAWMWARDNAVTAAKAFAEAGYAKQIVNRLLEPWMWTIVCVSSTEWENFLELRDHPDAEPHIQLLAKEVRKCLEDESTIQTLQPGQWHLPFANSEDDCETVENSITMNGTLRVVPSPYQVNEGLIKLSVARCASTSYKTVDGFDMTLEKAIALHDKLIGSTPLHASPAEHVAQADETYQGACQSIDQVGWRHPHQHGNFVGFRQYRHML